MNEITDREVARRVRGYVGELRRSLRDRPRDRRNEIVGAPFVTTFRLLRHARTATPSDRPASYAYVTA